jgi:hypothetical protein
MRNLIAAAMARSLLVGALNPVLYFEEKAIFGQVAKFEMQFRSLSRSGLRQWFDDRDVLQ